MRTRPDPVGDRLRRKLTTLRILSPADHRAIEEIIDDILTRRMAKIEHTEMWKGKPRHRTLMRS